MSGYEFDRRLADAARVMGAEREPTGTLQRAVEAAVELIDGCDVAGISVIRPDAINTSVATHESLRVIDQLQFQMQEGPCLDALSQDEPVISTNLATDDRWPRWGSHLAHQLNLHSSMSLQLCTSNKTTGALNLYAYQPSAFTHEDLLDGLTVAAHIGTALATAQQAEHLHRAMESRRLIGEATGILRERFGLTSDQAFGVLRRISSTEHTKLHQVAKHLVDTGALPQPNESPSKLSRAAEGPANGPTSRSVPMGRRR